MTFNEFDNNWLTVYKLNDKGEEVWRYNAAIVERGTDYVCVRAAFMGRRDEVQTGFLTFRRGDALTEWFFADRWYNIFRVQEGSRGPLKGFYCNITRPALLSEEVVSAEDLALDVIVSPRGEIMLVDEEEFHALALSSDERVSALAAVKDIRHRVTARTPPFHEIAP
ncbi:MAG: DUF402 domain-containing protein [Chloroflexi bacterium]|nr:DUF402 domain-containing protein [Chloroflexota bacterium]